MSQEIRKGAEALKELASKDERYAPPAEQLQAVLKAMESPAQREARTVTENPSDT